MGGDTEGQDEVDVYTDGVRLKFKMKNEIIKEACKVSLGLLVVSQRVDALAQDEQRGVDVPRLLQPLALVLGLGASLGAGQVAQTQPDGGDSQNQDTLQVCRPKKKRKLSGRHPLADGEDPRAAHVFNPQNANGEDAVAAESGVGVGGVQVQ